MTPHIMLFFNPMAFGPEPKKFICNAKLRLIAFVVILLAQSPALAQPVSASWSVCNIRLHKKYS